MSSRWKFPWRRLPTTAVTKVHGFLVSWVSRLLNYFIALPFRKPAFALSFIGTRLLVYSRDIKIYNIQRAVLTGYYLWSPFAALCTFERFAIRLTMAWNVERNNSHFSFWQQDVSFLKIIGIWYFLSLEITWLFEIHVIFFCPLLVLIAFVQKL